MVELKLPVVAGFHIKEQIGGGGFSSVYRATNPALDIVAACKVVALTPTTPPHTRKALDKEMQVHASLKHVHVLEFLNAVVVEPGTGAPWVPAVYMLLEIAAGGDLFDKIVPDVGVDEDLAHLYFTQLIAGVRHIHSHGIAHRDLKPENLLLDVAGQIKIADFGLCAVFRYKGQTRALAEQCGSLPYVAPELAMAPQQAYAAEPVDLWGAGVILFTLLCGNTPWDEPTAASPEYARYVAGTIFSEAPWPRIPRDALSLMRGLLTVDPAERMTMHEVRRDPWFCRESGLARETGTALAEHLTRGLRAAGDLALAEPQLDATGARDADGDEVMLSAAAASQFTQTLQLFSQTQSGARYCPHLTRFYATAGVGDLMGRVISALTGFGVKHQVREADRAVEGEEGEGEFRRVKIGGYDARKERFTGVVEVERFTWAGGEREGSFCVMKREKGSPISWRQLWKALVTAGEVSPVVLRRGR